jgi:hypothetical protein
MTAEWLRRGAVGKEVLEVLEVLGVRRDEVSWRLPLEDA